MRRLAKYLGAICAKLKVKQLRILLFVFWVTGILLFGHAMLYPPALAPYITPIRSPQNGFENGINERAAYNREVYRRIKIYKAMLNDSVIKARPGLKDSLQILEFFYEKK